MSSSQAHVILRGADVRPHLTGYWTMSTSATAPPTSSPPCRSPAAGCPGPTRNQWDLVDFLEQVDRDIAPGKTVIASWTTSPPTAPPPVQAWMDAHPRWSTVFTPKHASWLNQVEIFFSILTKRVLKHGQFDSPHDLATQMLAYVEEHNLTAKPFAWPHTGMVLAA